MEKQCRVITLGTGYTAEWHSMRMDTVSRFYYIHGGEGYYTVHGITRRFETGHFYFLPWYVDFSLTQNAEDPLRHTYLNFFSTVSPEAPDIIDLKFEDCPFFEPISELLVSLAARISKEHHPGFFCNFGSSEDIACLPLLKSAVFQLFDLIESVYRYHPLNGQGITEVLLYMQMHFDEKITVAELAKIACFNKRYFIKKFTELLDCTPYQYLQKLRYSIVQQKIAEGNSVNSAVEFAGFSSVSAYYQAEKKYGSDSVRN